MSVWSSFGKICCGFLIGTAGVKLLSSSDAKKAYTHVTAAVLRASDDVMKTAETIKENCQDISTDAKTINEKRKADAEAKEIADAKAVLAAAEEKQKAEQEASDSTQAGKAELA